MQIDELRLKVQNALKSERGVTDVAFTPYSSLPLGVELVSFWEGGVRAHFAVVMDYLEAMPYMARVISNMAEAALASAKVKAAQEAADRADEASKQVRVLAA